jgi:hypothetical protein
MSGNTLHTAPVIQDAATLDRSAKFKPPGLFPTTRTYGKFECQDSLFGRATVERSPLFPESPMFMEPSSNEITPQTPSPFDTSTDRVRKYFQQLKYYDSSSPTPSGKKQLPANVKSNVNPDSDRYEEKDEQLPGVNEYQVAEDALRVTEPPSEGGEQQDEQQPPGNPSKVADDASAATEPPSEGEDPPVEELQLPDGVYLTERVVESRRTSGKLWLKIKWKGVKTPSWELAEHMRNELGEEDYKELLETKPRKRRKKASKW